MARVFVRNYLVVTALIAGMTTLGVEVSAQRMVANVYGSSDVVWASIIALVLGYVTIGYFIGGRLADRLPSAPLFYQIVVIAAGVLALVPYVLRPVLYQAAASFLRFDIPAVLGWVGVTSLLFAPLIFLGCVTPFIIRLAVEGQTLERSGQIAGQVLALTTLGSIVGSLSTTLLLTPRFGTGRTFLLFALAQALMGWGGLLLHREEVRWKPATMLMGAVPLVVGGLVVSGVRGQIKPVPQGMTLLYETETAYNLVQVAQTPDGTRYLYLNEGIPVHSVYSPTQEVTFTGTGTWDFFLAGPYFNEAPYDPAKVDRLAIIGLAGGTIARQYDYVYGPIPIDGIEIDRGLIEVGNVYFGMEELASLNAIAADGRMGLRSLGGGYDQVVIDAYKVPYVPWHLTTVEFYQEVHSHLAEDGVLTLNVGRTSANRELVNSIVSTLREVFPSVHVADVPGTFNSIVYATRQPTLPENLAFNITALEQNGAIAPALPRILSLVAGSIQPTAPPGMVFTDDRAPLEFIVHRLIFEYILTGDYAELVPPEE